MPEGLFGIFISSIASAYAEGACMSSRIAHRPHYRTIRHLAQVSHHARQDFFAKHWTYRRQHAQFEKRPLGYGLSLIPIGYRWMQGVLMPQA